jgi:hypothetical protein
MKMNIKKTVLTVLAAIGAVLLLAGVLLIAVQQATRRPFFPNECICTFTGVDVFLTLGGGLMLFSALFVLSFTNKKRWYVTAVCFLLAAVTVAGLGLTCLCDEPEIFRRTSPDGKTELVIRNWGFLSSRGSDVYLRNGSVLLEWLPCISERAMERFGEDYQLTWYGDCVVIDGRFVYSLPVGGTGETAPSGPPDTTGETGTGRRPD